MMGARTRLSAGRPRKADVPSPDDGKAARQRALSRMQIIWQRCPSAAEIAAIDDPSRPRSIASPDFFLQRNSRWSRSPRASMSEQPFYVVFAMNGAGKSTYSAAILRTRRDARHGARAPTKSSEQGGDWSNGQDRGRSAGRIALRSVDEHLAAHDARSIETTLAGHRALHHGRSTRRIPRVPACPASAPATRAQPCNASNAACRRKWLIDEAPRSNGTGRRSESSKALPTCEEAHVLDNTVAFGASPYGTAARSAGGRVEVSGSMASAAIADAESHRRRRSWRAPTRAFSRAR